jgi:mRNA interferase RelE/StbE
VSFRVLLHPRAAKFLEKLDAPTAARIKENLKRLEERPQLGKRLRYFNFWSLRVGEYRVIYEIWRKEGQIVVLFIGHRRDVYEDLSRLF